MPTPTPTILLPSVCVAASVERRAVEVKRVRGKVGVVEEVEGVEVEVEVGRVEVEVRRVEVEVGRVEVEVGCVEVNVRGVGWLWGVPFVFFLTPLRRRYLAFIDCHEWYVTLWASARSHSLLPVGGY